jgi:hypothetical protein
VRQEHPGLLCAVAVAVQKSCRADDQAVRYLKSATWEILYTFAVHFTTSCCMLEDITLTIQKHQMLLLLL